MDPFLQYLIVVNVVAFLAFAVDFLLYARHPAIDDSAANSLVMSAFPVAGGTVGALLALFLFTGLLPRRRMNKHNIAWWFTAIVCLIVWALVAAVKLGHVSLDASAGGISSGWDVGRLKVLGVYLVVVNVVAFAAFAWDKHVAASGNDHGRRVPESWLLGLCLVGGSVGGLIAMHAVRHKTRKWYFVWGLPLLIVLHVVLIACAHMGGIL